MLKSYGWVGWWVAHKILVTAQVLGFGLDFGLGLVNRVNIITLVKSVPIENFLNLYCGCSITKLKHNTRRPKKLHLLALGHLRRCNFFWDTVYIQMTKI